MKYCSFIYIFLTKTFSVAFSDDIKPTLGIIGGVSAEFKDAALSYVKLYVINEGTISFCGGTLIQHDKILTAAHCVDRAIKITCCVGSVNCSVNAIGDTCVTIDAETSVFLHVDYLRSLSVGHIFGDIAIIQLKTPITHPNIRILPVCRRKFCGESLARYHYLVGKAFGCGRTRSNGRLAPVLQETDLATVEIDNGMEAFGHSMRYYQEDYKLIYTTFTTPKLGRTCKGDSGGMLSFYNKEYGMYEICGITSFSGPNCPANVPTAFTAVEAYYDFVMGTKNRIPLNAAKVELKKFNQAVIEEIKNKSSLIPIHDKNVIAEVENLSQE